MHTPTKAQWQVVIDNLKKVLPLAARERHLNMMEPDAKSNSHECGTIHCFGGWYAVAACDHNEEYLGYDDGANEMAKHLGLKEEGRDGEFSIEDFASNNKYIWGNSRGHLLFISREAFISPSRPDGALTLQHIVDHLEEVRDRSPE